MTMRAIVAALILSSLLALAGSSAHAGHEKKLNNLVSELLEVCSIPKSAKSFTFSRSTEGWIFMSVTCKGKGTVKIVVDKATTIPVHAEQGKPAEAVRYVTKGTHEIQVSGDDGISAEKLVVKAIPDLIHCGLGFDPQIKSYGRYDMDFLKKDGNRSSPFDQLRRCVAVAVGQQRTIEEVQHRTLL